LRWSVSAGWALCNVAATRPCKLHDSKAHKKTQPIDFKHFFISEKLVRLMQHSSPRGVRFDTPEHHP
jgi:hypothetical protein